MGKQIASFVSDLGPDIFLASHFSTLHRETETKREGFEKNDLIVSVLL